MTLYYKALDDEMLKQEIRRLKAILSAMSHTTLMKQGFEEVLAKYQEELDLREKLPL